MNKKQIFLWMLYDFANSIAGVVFFLYFSQWLVVDNGVSDFWYNAIFIGASALLLLAGPIAGSIADKIGRQMPFLRFATYAQIVFYGVAALLATYAAPTPAIVLLAALAFLLSNFFFQFSLIFYNALIFEVAPAGKQGWISGLGQCANWSGSVVGLLITLPFLKGWISIGGILGRAQTLLPSVILMAILILPTLLLFKESKKHEPQTYRLRGEYKNYWREFVTTCRLPGLGMFLLAFFFFNDAILTLVNNFPIYIEQVMHLPDTTKAFLMIGILATSAVGGLIGGSIADRIGAFRATTLILLLWIIVLPLFAATVRVDIFIFETVILGTLYGATWAITRALMVTLTPPARLNHAFSYYTLAERFSTFIGPLGWGLVTSGFVAYGAIRYQMAALVMTIFILIGLAILRKVPLTR